ncbi:MAG TPA: thiamine diphosphokinase [Candidatus Limnocylindrales bacterium]|nr:thiamine diphosphokinase [Candidatus Limnocylindrales bacterium]
MSTGGHALILADGAAPDLPSLDRAWPGWDDGIDLVIAADGGARHAAGLGRPIDLWVGDGDSLGAAGVEELRAAGVPVRLAPIDKDESDTELAIVAAIAAGATRLTLVGALGGTRIDHGLANVWLLAHPALAPLRACLLDDRARIRLLAAGRHDLGGRIGDLISLFAFGGDAEGLTTHGLRYRLADEALRPGSTRGLSNVREAAEAGIDVRSGRVLLVEIAATL